MRNNEINLDGLDDIFNSTDEIDRDIEKNVDFRTNVDYDDALDALNDPEVSFL